MNRQNTPPDFCDRTVAIVQARMCSSRLPGKVMRDICGAPMVERTVERLMRCTEIDEVVVATSDTYDDRELARFCRNRGWPCFTGHPTDVLDRYRCAAAEYDAGRIVRITADCPLIDSCIVDEVINELGTADYACNFFPRRSFPRGLDCEVFTRQAMEKMSTMVTEQRHREHVTLYFYESPEQFRINTVASENDHSYLRWTVDTLADLLLVREIYGHFRFREFNWTDVIGAYKSHPHWLAFNRDVQQKAA